MKSLKDWSWMPALALIALTVAAYVPAMQGGFVWDDDDYVTNNLTLRSADGLRRIWFDITATPQYYPLTFTSFWIEYQLWDAQPLGYHAVNIMLHAANAVLLWLVLARLAVPGAWLAAAVFALHPVQVESVAWITERKNVLSGLFYMSALLAYLRSADLPTKDAAGTRSWRMYALALLLFVCALFCKTVTLSLPVAILLVLWWKRARVSLRELIPLLPMFVVGAALGMVTVWMEKQTVGAFGEAWSLSAVERGLIAGRALWFYLGKLIWPSNLTFIYPRWIIDAGIWWQYLFPAAAAAALLVLWALRKRLGTASLVAVLFFGLTLAPALGFVDVYPMRYSFVADHFQYLACIGPIALFAGCFTRVLRARGTPRRRVAAAPIVRTAIAGLMLCALGALTWQRGRVYADLETLWADTIAKNPTCWMAYTNLGLVLQNRGEEEAAVRHYETALEIRPDLAQPHNNLGVLLLEKGRRDEAHSHFLQALSTDPDYADAHYNLGCMYEEEGELAEAAAQYIETLRINPRYAPAHMNLGNVYARRQDYERAADHYLDTIRLDPENLKAHNNLGNVYALRGRFGEAAAQYSEVVRLDPNHAMGHMNLGHVLRETGRVAEAVDHYREALRLEPDRSDAALSLAWILATHPDDTLRDGREAVRLGLLACEATGYRDPVALDVLAAAYAEAGRFDEAVTAAQKAIDVAPDRADPQRIDAIQQRLELYLSGLPYRSATGPTTPPIE